MTNKLLTETLSVPLDGTTTATIDVNSGNGNLAIHQLADNERVLVSGTLEYFEKQGRPTRFLTADHGVATVKLMGFKSRQPWFRFPWDACNCATEWRIQLNPTVASDISVRTGGGNLKLNLEGMVVTHVAADTGAGNVEVVLPDHAAGLSTVARTGAGNVAVEIGSHTTGSNMLDAQSGAGNVVVRVPAGIAARVHASSGLGKVVMEPDLRKMDRQTYQSPDYETAVNKVDITVKSGAGDVSVTTK